MYRHLIQLLRRDDAATAVEYAVVLALVLMTAIGAVAVFGQSSTQTWNSHNDALKAVNFGS